LSFDFSVAPALFYRRQHRFVVPLDSSDEVVAFGVESSGLKEAATAGRPGTPVSTPTISRAAEVRPSGHIKRTYLVCVDSLHTAFSNPVHVREAMLKLFGEEHEGDAQYTVVLIGSQISMLRDSTSDPAAVLSALGSKDLEKAYLTSRRGSIEALMAGFRQDLARVRAACDHPGQPGAEAECAAGKLRLQSQADQSAGFERLATIEFVRQFRSLVQYLGAADGRRSIVLASDGFNMVPGQAAYLLLAACFPEIQGASFRANERIIGELEAILRMAQQKSLPVYTIDSRGLYAMPLYSAVEARGHSAGIASNGCDAGPCGAERRRYAAADCGGDGWFGFSQPQRFADRNGASLCRWSRLLHAGLRAHVYER
jgi:hypothetical protein